jgi:glucan exporter ATP-binding protein
MILWAEPLLTLTLVGAGGGAGVIALAEPVLFGRTIESLSRGRINGLALSMWAGLGLTNVIISVYLAVMADRLAHRMRLRVMGEVFENTISLPVSFHAEMGAGRLIRSILAGADQLFYLWLSFLREQLYSLVGITLLIPTALAMNWKLALVLFVLGAIYVTANCFVVQHTTLRQADVEIYHQDVFGRVGDVIGNVAVVQSYVRFNDESKALEQIMARLLSAQYPVLTWWGILNVITRISSTLTLVVILSLGSYLAIKGEMTVAQILAFAGFASLLIGRLDQISSFLSRGASQTPTLATFFDLYDRRNTTQDLPHARPFHDPVSEVRFEDVTYHYGGKGGVYNLNFAIPAGKTVALVGPSGSGKTTTMALLQRLFDPQSGRISVNGIDIRDFTVQSLRHVMAAVFQDTGLFNRSIAENIRIGRPSATDAEMESAAIQAEAHDFILTKSGGYQFVIGERGSLLSGGERQRLAIARAILKNAPIFIFDEATSALDNETEAKIQSALQVLRKDKTTFIIAHRLSTVVNADLILVFDGGRIVQSGTFSELERSPGIFRRLLRAGQLIPTATEHEEPAHP